MAKQDQMKTWLDKHGIKLPESPDWITDYALKYQVMMVNLDEVLYQIASNENIEYKVRLQALNTMAARARDLANHDPEKPKNDKPFTFNFNIKKNGEVETDPDKRT